ncbi:MULTISPECIES: hypothetical protein [unclassified Pseudomonas]|uniref:hypothetical protein n=1 Tax=Pseudomonas TaxID=286 RepID=UPI0020B67B8E|nr:MULTISPECIES: hypothetical protein [unclassified Pseudomonas]MCP3791925.1 hypothetical protein [Pseudomonas sp. N2-11]MDI3373220.1 hypothetical protein [Pseudomonas sp. V104_6]
MKRILIATLVTTSVALLSGCWESKDEQKAKAQQEASDKLWNIPKPDRSKDKGFTP